MATKNVATQVNFISREKEMLEMIVDEVRCIQNIVSTCYEKISLIDNPSYVCDILHDTEFIQKIRDVLQAPLEE